MNKQFRIGGKNTEAAPELRNHARLCRNYQDSATIKSKRIKPIKGYIKIHMKKNSLGA